MIDAPIPPTGRLTFLYTDLTDSSGMTHALGAACFKSNLLDPFIDRHSILKDAGGHLMQYKGDGYIFMFASARQSLTSAVAFFESLRDNPISHYDIDSRKTYQVECRIGIYTATADVTTTRHENGHLVSLDDSVNLASRLEGIGKSGQILVSDPTRQKVHDGAGFDYIVWKERQLKGNPVPVDVHELLWDPETNPQGRGEPGRRAFVLASFDEKSTYIERPDEEDAVYQAFKDNRPFVTIHGDGGMGKTRLAAYCIGELALYFPDGVRVVTLDNRLPSVESVKEAFCEAFKKNATQFTPETLQSAVRREHVLVVLDNYESVKCDEVRYCLEGFTHQASPIRFLVTSREVIGLPAGLEQIVSLQQGMSDAQAEALFIDRVQAAKGAKWEASDAEKEAIKSILKNVENVPLALELIAAWTGETYTLSEIADELDQRLLDKFTELPEGMGPLDNAKRHLSLRDSLDWSHEVLIRGKTGKRDALAFAALSLFADTFSRQTVAGILGWDDKTTNAAVTRLRKAALLRDKREQKSGEDKHRRYRYHRATREYAAERLDKHAQSVVIRHNYIAFWLGWLAIHDNIGSLDKLALLRQEWRNVSEASQVAHDAKNWAGVCALSDLNRFLRHEGRIIEAELLLQRAVNACDQLEDRRIRGGALNHLGLVFQAQNKYTEAEAAFNVALTIFREFGKRIDEGPVLHNLGRVYEAQNKHMEAEAVYDADLAICRESGDRAGEGETLNTLGNVYRAQGKYVEAELAYDAALVICREFGDQMQESRILNNLSGVYGVQNKLSEAEKVSCDALKICRAFENRVEEGPTLHNLGVTYEMQNKDKEAEAMFNAAIAIWRQLGDRVGEGKALVMMSLHFWRLRQLKNAIDYAEEAIAALKPTEATAVFEQAIEILLVLQQENDASPTAS